MKFTIEFPTERTGYAPEFLQPENIARFVQSAEAAGFDAVCFSEHPAPSRKWLAAGGHDTFDPIAALSFCAGVTSRIRLMTHLLVLPYRNPLLTAKAMIAVDILSGGRLTAVVGAGYLRSEFAALGVDFEERNKLFDEAVEVIGQAWSGPVNFSGRHFEARDQKIQPPPVQTEVPLWIGGNSKLTRRRVVRSAQGWAPLFTPGGGALASTARTASMDTIEQLASAIAEIREQLEETGRDPGALDVQVGKSTPAHEKADAQLEEIHELDAAGVTWCVIGLPGDSVGSVLDSIARFGEDVIDPSRR